MSARQRELEREVKLLKERLDASQTGWEAARNALEDRERQSVNCDAALRLHAFHRSLAELLSDGVDVVEASDEHIMQKLREMLYSVRDKAAVSRHTDT